MLTFQDYLNADKTEDFIKKLIDHHRASAVYKMAVLADEYDHQKNTTIYNYVRTIFTMTGTPVEDFTASNNRIASNFFHRLNTQRCTYLLGNGVSFAKNKNIVIGENGYQTTEDLTKNRLGDRFDTDLKRAGYKALIHGETYIFWNLDRMHIFPVTEFAPLEDEVTGALRAGVRFWQLDADKPMTAVLYEEDGYTKYLTDDTKRFVMVQEKRPYVQIVQRSQFDGEQIVGEENYSTLPIFRLYGSDLKQSTLVGMQHAIDSYDLIRSGFANDLTDCAQIYWILENAMGMDDADLARFRDRLKINHIAVADTAESKVTPYTQEIPYGARKAYLDEIRSGIYEDFGGLDVHTVAAGATNDHIDAAYQPLDEEADDFEYQIISFIQQLLDMLGIDDMPVFKRNRISNQAEQTDMIMSVSEYLDDETLLSKLPFITVDEVANILLKKDVQNQNRFENQEEEPVEDNVEQEEEPTE